LSFQQRGWVELGAGDGGDTNANFEATDNVGLGLSDIQSRESSEMDDEPPSSGHRNNSLFFGSAVSSDLPRPPPSRTMRKEPQLPPIITSSHLNEYSSAGDVRESHHSSLADRLRNIVAANRKTVVKTLPIPEHLRSDIPVSESSSPTSSNPSPTRNTTPSPSNSVDHKQRGHSYNPTFSSSSFSDDDSFLPLPSPAMAMTPSVSTSQFSSAVHSTKYIAHSSTSSPTDSDDHSRAKVDLDDDDDDNYGTNIPILSASPSYAPRKRQEIPSVIDFPILGDSVYEEHNKPTTTHISKKSHMFEPHAKYSASPLGSKREERMIGKTIWKFRIQKLLGVGAFSKVYLVDCTETGKKYAIKMISKDRLALDSRIRSSIDREVAILEYIDHPNVVQLDCTMETEHHFCLVLEHVDGGELYDYVEKLHGSLSAGQTVDEMLVKRLFLQLVNVMIWLHEKHIVHRDLKLENILVSSTTSEHDVPVLKLSDFGLARVIDIDNPMLRTRCGSEEYAAPEIIQNTGYDGRQTDTWALGVILYALLVGYLPFMYNPARGEKVSHLFYRILSNSQVKWPSEWTKDPSRSISEAAKDVVSKLLTRQPEKRITLSEVKTLPWFSDCDLDVKMG